MWVSEVELVGCGGPGMMSVACQLSICSKAHGNVQSTPSALCLVVYVYLSSHVRKSFAPPVLGQYVPVSSRFSSMLYVCDGDGEAEDVTC